MGQTTARAPAEQPTACGAATCTRAGAWLSPRRAQAAQAKPARLTQEREQTAPVAQAREQTARKEAQRQAADREAARLKAESQAAAVAAAQPEAAQRAAALESQRLTAQLEQARVAAVREAAAREEAAQAAASQAARQMAAAQARKALQALKAEFPPALQAVSALRVQVGEGRTQIEILDGTRYGVSEPLGFVFGPEKAAVSATAVAAAIRSSLPPSADLYVLAMARSGTEHG